MKKIILLIAIIAMSCQKEIAWSGQEIKELKCVPPTFKQDPTIIGHARFGLDNGALYIFPEPKTDGPFIYSLDGGKNI